MAVGIGMKATANPLPSLESPIPGKMEQCYPKYLANVNVTRRLTEDAGRHK